MTVFLRDCVDLDTCALKEKYAPTPEERASRLEEREAWLIRRVSLTHVTESHAILSRPATFDYSKHVSPYLNRAETLRELLLFVNRQISHIDICCVWDSLVEEELLCFTHPDSLFPTEATHDDNRWFKTTVLAVIPVVKQLAQENGWTIIDSKIRQSSNLGPCAQNSNVIDVAVHGLEDGTFEKQVQEYMHPLPTSCRPAEHICRNEHDLTTGSQPCRLGAHQYESTPTSWVKLRESYETAYRDEGKLSSSQKEAAERIRKLELIYSRLTEQLFKDLDSELDQLVGAPQAATVVEAQEPTTVEASAQPQAYEELMATVCQLQHDLATVTQILLRARDIDDDEDDDAILARLHSRHLSKQVIERLLANPFFQTQREKSRKRKAVEDKDAETVIKKGEGDEGDVVVEEEGDEGDVMVEEGYGGDTVVVETTATRASKRHKR